uniref:Neuronal pentraxin-2 n=2 Tax=Ciona intestinalis TaxID=7719 RepID=F6Z4Q2_CIOIN
MLQKLLPITGCLIFISCKHILATGGCQSNTNQVQICAPVSSLSALPGDSGDFFSQLNGRAGVRGKAGPKGEKGIRGPPGPRTENENECNCNEELERLRNEIRQFTALVNVNEYNCSEELESLRNEIRQVNADGCPSVIFNFSRLNQITDYVRYRHYVPQLNSATICMWVHTSDFTDSSLFSYATRSGHANEILIILRNSRRISFFLENKRVKDFTFSSMMNQWAHLCVWFSTRTSQLGVYINGNNLGSFPYTGGYVRGGGSLILGQDQDQFDAGDLQASQAFSGQISSPIIWPRVLTASEISDVTHRCICPRDYAITMTLDKVELHGTAGYRME